MTQKTTARRTKCVSQSCVVVTVDRPRNKKTTVSQRAANIFVKYFIDSVELKDKFSLR